MAISHFDTIPSQSYGATLKGVIRAVFTVIFVPEHREYIIHPDAARRLQKNPQVLQRPLNKEREAILSVLHSMAKPFANRVLSNKEILGFSGVLMQFTLYLPELRSYFLTRFEDIESLYVELIITRKKQRRPLELADQLRVALEQTGGNLHEALWLLFVCFRLYARWYDTGAVKDLPSLSKEQVISRMTALARAVVAAKSYEKGLDQDVLGDTYYCWTHILAKVTLSKPIAKQGVLAGCLKFAIHHGTFLNHNVAHKITPQIMKSNHTAAARYGNSIGALCTDYLQLTLREGNY